MTNRRSTQDDRPRDSLRVGRTAGPPPDSFEGLVSDVQAVAMAEEETASRAVELANTPWYRRPASAVALIAVAVAIWGVQAFFMQVAEPQVSKRDGDAALRFTMAQQVARIEDFRLANQRLPDSLTEVAESYQGMSFAVLDSVSYRLTGSNDRLQLEFYSDSSLKSFLGNSVELIRDRRK